MAIDLERAYRQYLPMVRRRCQQLLRDEDAAKDATQDVFVRLARRREELDDRALSSLLYRIATGICLNRIRDQKTRATTPDDDLVRRIATARDFAAPLFARRLLDTLFERESESTRVIATMHLLDGYTLQEVGDEFGLSVSGVRSRLRTLHKHLTELEDLEA
jgi:RNA polymerase sigma-70 factor (ECF subfamily)